jgi:hypothetical protein
VPPQSIAAVGGSADLCDPGRGAVLRVETSIDLRLTRRRQVPASGTVLEGAINIVCAGAADTSNLTAPQLPPGLGFLIRTAKSCCHVSKARQLSLPSVDAKIPSGVSLIVPNRMAPIHP